MGFINLTDKTISAKLVYYGAGAGGKTTSLEEVHKVFCPRDEVQLISINTEDDSTLLFDFLPIDLGQIEGFTIQIQGFTVPGQPKYKRMRKYVLQGADTVVFVVDSQASRLEENLQSLESMLENLRSNGLEPETIPTILQYNKRDLDDILPEAELDKHFKWREGIEAFPSIAHEGQGVFETFVHAAGLLIESKVNLYGLGRGSVAADVVAEGARARLWELYRSTLDSREENEDEAKSFAVTVPREEDETAEPDGDVDGQELLEQADEVFSDEDLDIELGAPPADNPEVEEGADAPSEAKADDSSPALPAVETDEASAPPALNPRDDEDDELLEEVIQTNVELAKQFGSLDEYKRLLERKNKDLVQVAQNTVHDLNRPLSVIKLMLSSMGRGMFGEVPGKMSDAIDNGLMAIDQMERLISELLDSSRLDYDGVQLEFREIDMTLLLAEVVRTLSSEIDERDCVCTVEPLPVMRGDEWALTKTFTNLIGNSLQYVHPDRRPHIRVSAEAEEDRNVIVIQDNGIGIPQNDIGRLFRRFERGSNTSGISGTGLGLHIVREAVFGHGGTVWVESVEGEGATFKVALPFKPVMPPHSSVNDITDAVEVTEVPEIEA